MYNKSIFAFQLKSLLETRGITQCELSERLHTTEATISRYTSGSRTPNIETAVEMSRILGVSVDELVGSSLPDSDSSDRDEAIWTYCYRKATIEQREALWGIVSSYRLITAEQKAVVDSAISKEKAKAV